MNGRWLIGLRHALRGLLRRPLASTSAVLTLALALSASAVLLLALHALYWAPLPYGNHERIHVVQADLSRIGVPEGGMSWALANEVEKLPAVAALAAWETERVAMRIGEYPESVGAVLAEPDLFTVLGQGAIALGRAIGEDDIATGEAVAIVSDEFARELFGSAEAALDAELLINGAGHRVIGVLAAGAGFPDRERRLILPLRTPAENQDLSGGIGAIQTVILLTDRTTGDQLQHQLDTLTDRLVAGSDEFKAMQDITGLHLRTMSWRERTAEGIAGTLGLLAAALAGLLLAGSNVSNVLMERYAARRGELAVRIALGATRARLVRLVTAEAVLLSVLGWLLGLALCAAILAIQQRWQLLDLPTGFTLVFAWPPLLASLLLTALLSLLTALFPAWLAARVQGSRVDLAQRGGTDGQAQRVRRALVVCQSAVSVALLVVAALLGRSLAGLWQVDPGYSREGVLTAEIEPRGERYAAPESRLALAQRLIDESTGLPGVAAVGISAMLPFGSNYSMSSYEIDALTDPEQPPVALSSSVSAGYFEAMGIPLLRGRAFSAQEDREIALPVAIIDQRLASRHFGTESPIGRRLRLGPGDWLEIVGVVGAVRQIDLADDAENGQIYLPMAWAAPQSIYLVLQTQLPIASVLPGLRHLLQKIDAGVPIRRTLTMEQRLDHSLRGRSGPLAIVAFFAAVAVLLAGLGLYGLLATAVVERRPEIGVRLALGAQRRDIIHGVLGDGLRLVIIGIVVGMVIAALAVPLLRHHLYGVGAVDPVSYAVSGALLLAIALIATVFPAWRAARVQPAHALRNE